MTTEPLPVPEPTPNAEVHRTTIAKRFRGWCETHQDGWNGTRPTAEKWVKEHNELHHKDKATCCHCNRPITRNTAPKPRGAERWPKREWVHNADDFDPKKPMDCLDPEPSPGWTP